MRERRWSAFLPSSLAHLLAGLSRPPSGIDSLAYHALRCMRSITDETHADALRLVEELAEIGARERRDVRGHDGGPGNPSSCTTEMTSSAPATATSP